MSANSTYNEYSALKNFLLNARSSGALSIVNITSVIYIIVLGLTFKDFHHLMPDWVTLVQIVGVSTIIVNMVILNRTKNVPLTAGIMLFCMFAIHMANITFAGGIDTPHFAWIFIFPILAGGTMGWRGQVFFWFISVIGTIYYAVYPENMDVLPYDGSMGYTLMTRLMCITVFSLITLIYYFTLSQKMQDLQKALKLASFESDLFLGVFNSKAQSALLVDADGKIERANAKAHHTFGYQPDMMLGKDIDSICDAEIDFSSDQIQSDSGQELLITTHAKNEVWIEYTSLKILDELEHVHTLLTIEDISTRKNHESELSYLAHFDYLTKLPNRLSIQDRLAEMIANSERYNRQFAVIFIDLDKFKNVNDIKGHEAGDTVLQEIALRLRDNISRGDIVARFGGDEFVILMDEVKGKTHIVSLIEQVQKSICKPIHIKNNAYFVGSSVGVSIYPNDGDQPNDLIRKADTAMYKAKSSSNGSYEFYNLEHDAIVKRLIKLGSELHYAIEREQLSLLFQPIYDINDTICGAEALIRWNHEELGKVSPDEFIPISEDNGLIVPIGLWVLDKACQFLKQLHDNGYDNLTMSINVSYRQINSDDMVNEVKRTLSKYQLNGGAIILELTERVFADDLNLVQQNITEFAELGVKTAVDDFGVGYSNLSYLEKTDFSSIKIDRSFIKDIEINSSAKKLCNAIMSMASSLGLSVTAEGVEKEQHLAILKAMKIERYQGYFMSKPIDSDAFEALLQKNYSKSSL
jgi:diguanylate cyclase (GGDEF)-like protein/PAS domain S-box-containing protein